MGAPAEQAFEISSQQEIAAPATFKEFRIEGVESSIPERFEKIVRLYPDRLAVKMAARELTYDELNRAANRIAHAIVQARGTKSEPIALLFEHGIASITAILAILKAGKFYLALDDSFPAERIQHILADSQAPLILTDSRQLHFVSGLAGAQREILNIDEVDAAWKDDNLDLPVSPRDSASLIYTSGSTGTPKGVVGTHRIFLYGLVLFPEAHRVGAADRATLFHSVAYGSALTLLFHTLLNGGCLLPYDLKSEGLHRVAEWLAEEEITVCHFPPAVFRQIAEAASGKEQLTRLRLIHLSGAPITRQDFELYKKTFSAQTLLLMGMGSTETRWLSYTIVDHSFSFPDEGVPIGSPVPAAKILLLDDDGQEVQAGQVGEIAVKSRYLTEGYWKQPEMTAAKFLDDPAGGDERIYLTGDVGRRLPDGFFVHLGRKDHMVKIRGFRVEIGEIERGLLAHPLLKDAGVAAWEREPGEKYLVGYVVARPPAVLTTSELRSFLLDRLPDYMIPSSFVSLDSLPLTNGKLDRTRLPVPDRCRPELATRYVAPRNELERHLVALWEDNLDVCPIGIEDDFFDLGGYSLLAAKLLQDIQNSLDVKVPLPLLAERSTIAQLAAQIAEFRKSDTHAKNESTGYKYLVKLQSAAGETPVFCLSHAGNYRGDLLRFAQLNRLVGRPYCFYGIQARGADGVSRPHNSVAEMAAAYIEEIQAINPCGPYYLIGECGAAPIAFEIAQQFQARGDHVGLLILLDARGFDPKTRRYFWRRYIWHRYFPWLFYSIHRVAQSQTLRRLRRSAGIRLPELCVLEGKKQLHYALLNSPRLIKMIGVELARRVRSGRQHNMQTQRFARALTRYPFYRMARLRYKYMPYAGKIAVIANAQWCDADPTLGWQRLARGGLEMHKIAGNHDNYITKNVRTVAQVLRECLQRAENE